MALSAGTRLGPYEILAPIGAGGMGEVYRARDRGLWTSLDDGRSWSQATVTGNGQVSGIAFSPIDDRNILAAARNGLFESRDGGQTWQSSGDGIDYGWSMAVRFNRAGDAYVGTSGGGVYLRRKGQQNVGTLRYHKLQKNECSKHVA